MKQTDTAELSETLRRKARMLHGQIASLQRWAAEAGMERAKTESLVAPYYRMLDTLYGEDFPLASLLEDSDLVLRMDGEAVAHAKPRISLIATVFQSVRKRVGAVAYALSGVTGLSRSTLPGEVDLSLSAYAPGSLYLGFNLPPPEQPDKKGNVPLSGVDPLYEATRAAIKALGVVSEMLNRDDSEKTIAREYPDPRVRDTLLSAVRQLAPTGRTGISTVQLGGRESGLGQSLATLTPEIRQTVKGWTEHPVKSTKIESFEGTVREIDLDVRRFELRRISGTSIQEIRCIYAEDMAGDAEQWLNERLRVTGTVECDAAGEPKLLEATEILVA